MLSTLLIFGYGKDGVENVLENVVKVGPQNGWVVGGVYYYEVLVRKFGKECCMLFCCHDDDGQCEKREAIRQLVVRAFGAAYVREIRQITLLQGVRYVRLLYRVWAKSDLYAKYTTEEVLAAMSSCGRRCKLVEEEMRAPVRGVFAEDRLELAREELVVLQSVEMMNALHTHIAKEMMAVYHEPTFSTRTWRRNSLASSSASSSLCCYRSCSMSTESMSECASSGVDSCSEDEFPTKVPLRDKVFMVSVSAGAVNQKHVRSRLSHRSLSSDSVLDVVGGVLEENRGRSMSVGCAGVDCAGAVRRQSVRFLAPPVEMSSVLTTPPGMSSSVMWGSDSTGYERDDSVSPLSVVGQRVVKDGMSLPSVECSASGSLVCDRDDLDMGVYVGCSGVDASSVESSGCVYDVRDEEEGHWLSLSDSQVTLESETYNSAEEAEVFAHLHERKKDKMFARERLFYLGSNFRRQSTAGCLEHNASMDLLCADMQSI